MGEKPFVMARLCPVCKRPLPPEAETAPHRPFCSPRCKMADLGSWLTGGYRISRPLAEEDLDEGLPPGGSRSDTDDNN
jgi:uncharacterized protein